MTTITKSKKRVTRSVTQDNPIVYAGDDNGNNTHVLVYREGIEGDTKVFTGESWIHEHLGSMSDLNPVSNSKGLTFTYIKGKSEFEGRTFLCGRAAQSVKGSGKATLIGDDPEHKVNYGLPMLLFALASQIDRSFIDAVVFSNTHKQLLNPILKESLQGQHEIEVLTRDNQNHLLRASVTLSIRAGVVKEGLGGLWEMSGAGAEGNYLINFEDLNLVCDGGGGTFDVLAVENGDFIDSDSVSIGGNDIVNSLLSSENFQGLFPPSIEVDRSLVETAIKEGTWTYSKGKVCVNFNKVGKTQIEEFLPLWERALNKVSKGRHIEKTALIGGLFQTRYVGDADGKDAWSLSEMFQDRFINHDFVSPENPQITNAKGLLEIALGQAETVGK